MMKNFTLKLMVAVLGAGFLFSCQSSSDLTSSSIIKKRRYTKGYQLNIKTPVSDRAVETYASHASPKPHRASVATEIDIETAAPVTTSAHSTTAEIATPKADPQTDVWTRSVEANPAYTKPSERTDDREAAETSPYDRAAAKHIDRTNAVMGTPVATPSDGSLLLYIILAILIPPLAVGLLYGIGTEFWISLILTLLFFIPGMVYALIMVLQY